MILPPEATPLLLALAPAFTAPTFDRVTTLLVAAILTPGRHTVANLLRTLGPLADGHRTTDQRVLSRAPWSGVRLGCALAGFLLDHVLPAGPVVLVGDDTVEGHPGRHVYGKARHRDPVRSSHAFTAWRYGHKGVVLAVLVQFPFAARRWALPVLVDLDRAPALNRVERRPHRTPARLMCRLLRLLLLRFPGRHFVFVGDAGYAAHAVARFCARHRGRLTLVSKLHPDANLYAPPPRYRGTGRPRLKGRRLPKPRTAAARARRVRPVTVDWYGGGRRRVGVVTGRGPWSKAGRGLVPLAWVFVRDRTGTHRDEFFFTTDPALTAGVVIGLYAGRWNIETTFEELRRHLGLETTRGWCRGTVERAAPCLFGLYTVVAVLYHRPPAADRGAAVAWPGKATVTFSDAQTAVRRWLWAESVFPQAGAAAAIEKLPPPVRELLLTGLAPAA